MKIVKQRIDREVAIIDRKQRRPAGFDGADDEPAEKGAGQRADAADDRRGQRLQGQRRRKAVADRAEGRRHDRAGEAGERAGERESAGGDRGRTDAHQLGGERIVGIGAPFAADPGPAEEDDEAEPGGERDRAGDEAPSAWRRPRSRRARERERLVEQRAHPARRSPCARRRSSRRNSARPTVATSTCWPRAWRSGMKTRPRRGEAPDRRDRGGEREGGGQQGGGRRADHGQRRDRRRVAAGRGQFAEGEIDPPDQAVDQRIGGREQRVDRRRAAGRRAPSAARRRAAAARRGGR